MTTHVTDGALDALNKLTDSARSARSAAARLGLHGLAVECETIAQTLDAARTRLVQDGAEYLEPAWAFVDAARNLLADVRINLDRAEMSRTHA